MDGPESSRQLSRLLSSTRPCPQACRPAPSLEWPWESLLCTCVCVCMCVYLCVCLCMMRGHRTVELEVARGPPKVLEPQQLLSPGPTSLFCPSPRPLPRTSTVSLGLAHSRVAGLCPKPRVQSVLSEPGCRVQGESSWLRVGHTGMPWVSPAVKRKWPSPPRGLLSALGEEVCAGMGPGARLPHCPSGRATCRGLVLPPGPVLGHRHREGVPVPTWKRQQERGVGVKSVFLEDSL